MKKIIILIAILCGFGMAQQSFKNAVDTLGRCWNVYSAEKNVVDFKCDYGEFAVFTDTMSIMIKVNYERLKPNEKGIVFYCSSFGKSTGKKTTRIVIKDEFNVMVSAIDLKFINPYEIYEYFKKTTLNKPRKKVPLADVGRVYTNYKPQPTPEDIKIAKIMEKYK